MLEFTLESRKTEICCEVLTRGFDLAEDCCSEVVPENSARNFEHPAAIVKKALNDKFIEKGDSIFEVGSGCLRNGRYLIDEGYRVTVKELEAVVKGERYHRKYELFVKKGGKVLFEWPSPGSSDIVICTFAMETICRKDQRLRFLNRLIHSLKKKGKLVIAVRGPRDVKTIAGKGRSCGDGYITPSKTFIKPFMVRELTALLTGKGLKILKTYGGSKSNEPQIIEVVAEKQ